VLVSELQPDGLLPDNVDITSVEELLDTLDTSTQIVEMVDIPPLNVEDMRTSWDELKDNTTDLPKADRLANLFEDIQGIAKRQDRSIDSVSTIMAAYAARSGIQLGQTYIFDYY
jgi:hypothetical protein